MAQYLLCITLSLLACTLTTAFENGESLKVMVNKVSPFANPSESYRYNWYFNLN